IAINGHIKFNLTIPLQQLNGLETLVIIMVANKYAFLQITRRRFLNEWEAFKKVISRRNIRRRITIPLTLSNLKLLRRITRTENILHRNFTRRQVAIQNRVASNIGISQSTFSVKVLNLFSRSRRKTNKRKSKHSAMLRNKENPDEAVPSFVSGAMAKAGKGLLEGTLQAGTSAVSDKLLDLVGLGGKSAADKGKDTRDYLAAAFPELNAWERAGADASSAGMVDAGFENQKELTKMQLDNQKEIAEMQNETQKEIAGIQSATSRQNTKDQVYAQNEMLAYQQKESTARVASIMENTNLSK